METGINYKKTRKIPLLGKDVTEEKNRITCELFKREHSSILDAMISVLNDVLRTSFSKFIS